MLTSDKVTNTSRILKKLFLVYLTVTEFVRKLLRNSSTHEGLNRLKQHRDHHKTIRP